MAKILIVEDDISLQRSYNLILKQKGFSTRTASNGREAIDLLTSYNPDIILLDINMPNMDGIEFLKVANPAKSMPKTKVIAFTNLEETALLNEAYSLGVSRYVLKASMSPKDLINLIDDLLV